MTSYSQLAADVDRYTESDEIDFMIPTFVLLAEELIAEDIRVRAMTTRDTLMGDGTRFVALPDDYLDLRRLERKGEESGFKLTQIAPEAMSSYRSSSPRTREPIRYCILDTIEFDTELGAGAEVDIVYWARFPAINSDNETNWLVQNAYGVYLYATLLQAAPFLSDDDKVPMWETAYQKHKQALSARDKESRIGSEPRVITEGAELLP